MHCHQCGKICQPTFKFCPACGAALHTRSSIPPGDITAHHLQAENVVSGVQIIQTADAKMDDAEALQHYRRVMAASLRRVALRGVDVAASDPTSARKQPDLARVYVALDTQTQIPREEQGKQAQNSPPTRLERGETRPLSALEAAATNRHLVLLGDPGSGKSTFVHHLAYALMMAELEADGDWAAHIPGWPEAELHLVPLTLILRDFASWLSQAASYDAPCRLWDFAVTCLGAQNLQMAVEPLHRALEAGTALILLDGLDEIPTRDQRAAVREAVTAFAQRYAQCRVMVTCRTLSYQDAAWQLTDFPAFTLAAFDEAKINNFINAWYAELRHIHALTTQEATELAQRLKHAVRRPDLRRLAPNPLLLTVMTLVHTHGHLPDSRALLYEETVNLLLWRWEEVKASDTHAPTLRQLLRDAERGEMDLKRTLGELAFEAHRTAPTNHQDGALADIGELRLEKALARLHPANSRDWAQKVVAAIKLRAGLLVERAPEVYTFPHRTFQEYLAGAHLSAAGQFAQQAAALVDQGAFWREVILLAVGRLVYHNYDTDKPLALVGELCPRRSVDDDLAWRKAWLAGEVLLEMGLNRVQDSALGRDLLERVQARLVDLIEGGCLRAVARAAAGRVLGKIGDPRPGVGIVVAETLQATSQRLTMTLPDIVWCEVPGGAFLMGSTDADEQADDDEKPQRRVDVPGFYISRYPVTNAQFATFVQAGGYQTQRYWTASAREQVWSAGQVKAWNDDAYRAKPCDFGEPFNLPNHPVVGITWYEMVAFCRWLEEQVQVAHDRLHVWAQGQIKRLKVDPSTLNIRLPSETEWEKAARGPALHEGNETGERIYPWGNEADAERANYRDTGIGSTSAVGCFPGGASVYGVLDMSGNVWEWCATKGMSDYGNYQEDNDVAGTASRALRGGAFDDNRRRVRCAYRGRGVPHDRDDYLGFRLVASPSARHSGKSVL